MIFRLSLICSAPLNSRLKKYKLSWMFNGNLPFMKKLSILNRKCGISYFESSTELLFIKAKDFGFIFSIIISSKVSLLKIEEKKSFRFG